MPGLTPMLALMAGEDVERRQRWLDSQAKAGRVKLTTFVPQDSAATLKEFIAMLRGLDDTRRQVVLASLRMVTRDIHKVGKDDRS